MTTEAEQPNPFSTRFIGPAVSEYLFPADGELGELLSRFDAANYQGQIVGPHGSGKTTLLHALRRELEAAGFVVIWLELHDGQRRLPDAASRIGSEDSRSVAIVDGYEQLSWWSRRRLNALCDRANCGLLFTTHVVQQGLPMIHETRSTIEIAQAIVARLMLDEKGIGCFLGHHPDAQFKGKPEAKKAPAPLFTPDEVAGYFHAAGGDIREMLFRLYDLYEERANLDRP